MGVALREQGRRTSRGGDGRDKVKCITGSKNDGDDMSSTLESAASLSATRIHGVPSSGRICGDNIPAPSNRAP